MRFLVDTYSCTSCINRFWLPNDPNDMQNMLIVGGPSSDKEKHLDDILSFLYGEGYKHMKETEYVINNYGSNSTKIKLAHSNYHIVIVPNNSALDKYILQEAVIDFCRKQDLVFFKGKTKFKTVVIHRADNLSEQAQFCLRRVMETTSRFCRFLLLSMNPCNFIMPIRSRLIQVNIPTPKKEQIRDFLAGVAEKEGIPFREKDFHQDRRNYRVSLWRLESYRHGVPYMCWWEQTTDQVVHQILHSSPMTSLKSMTEIRERFGQLFVSNIDSHMVVLHMMKTMFSKLPHDADPKKLAMLASVFACFDCRLKNATRYILHMEALVHGLCAILHGTSSFETPNAALL